MACVSQCNLLYLHALIAGLVGHVKHDPLQVIQLGLTAMQALVQGREIEHLLVRLHQLLVRSGLPPEEPWVVDEAAATIDPAALGKYIGTLHNQSLRKPLSRMRDYLKAEDKVRSSLSMCPDVCCTLPVRVLQREEAAALRTNA